MNDQNMEEYIKEYGETVGKDKDDFYQRRQELLDIMNDKEYDYFVDLVKGENLDKEEIYKIIISIDKEYRLDDYKYHTDENLPKRIFDKVDIFREDKFFDDERKYIDLDKSVKTIGILETLMKYFTIDELDIYGI